MHANLKVLLGMVALAAGPLLAGEPAKAEAEPKRQLLQPPKMEVASPITPRRKSEPANAAVMCAMRASGRSGPLSTAAASARM